MSWNLKLFYQQKFLVEKILQQKKFLFWIKHFHVVYLLRYSKEVKWKRDFFIYGEFYTKNYKTIFFRTITCRCMSRNVGIELPIWQGNEHVFSCSTLNWLLLMLDQYGCPNTSTLKNDFSVTQFFFKSI